ncbi:MAG: NACHT domain-containing protein, partial [Dolichospermum sp.]
NNDNAPKNLDPGKILDAITIEQGILVERARDVFSFSHLTLQEYLTAQYIDDHRLIEKLVTEHLTDERWKEVFLLVAGVMRGGADDLLLLMEKEGQQYINTPKLQALLNWAEEVTVGSQGDYKPVGKRAVAIALAKAFSIAIALDYANANAFAYALEYAKANANALTYAYTNANSYAYAITIENDKTYTSTVTKVITNRITNPISYVIFNITKYIDEVSKLNIYNQKLNFTLLVTRLEALKAKIPDDKQPEEVRQAFAKTLRETLLNGFNLTPEMVDLSGEETKALDNYLYANFLIIQCKEAAVRVSPTTWEGIEARMLLVGNN